NFSSTTPFQWKGGTIAGGANGLTNTGDFIITSPTPTLRTVTLTGKLTNSAAGTITQTGNWSGGFGNTTLAISLGATLINQGDYEMKSTAGTIISGPGTLINNGTFDRSGGNPGSIAKISAIVNNPGTMEVDVGTLTLSNTVTQLIATTPTTGTLTAGTWIVNGTSSKLTFSMGPPITTIDNSATVSLLGGAGATFTNISELEFIYGTFTLDGGATFTTSGDLFNAGTIAVGTGSQANSPSFSGSILTVTGDFFEFGTLNIHVGSQANSKEFGQVVVD